MSEGADRRRRRRGGDTSGPGAEEAGAAQAGAGETVGDETVVAPRNLDETVVAPRSRDLDETVVAPRVTDETVVVPGRGPDSPANPSQVSDETVVAPRVSDETVVTPRPDAPSAGTPSAAEQARTEASQVPTQSYSRSASFGVSQSGTGGLPVEEPEIDSSLRSSLRASRQLRRDSLDPTRRIASPPWEADLVPEPGVRPGLPVAYGPRPAEATVPDLRSIGAPPQAIATTLVDRAGMPSLRRKSRRRSVVTLTAYVSVIAVSAAGLWLVASLAFV